MNLLFLSQYFPPETGAGATRAAALQRYLAEEGWEIDVLCEMPNYPSGEIDKKYRNLWYHRSTSEKGSVIRTWVIPTRRETFFQQMLMFASFMVSSLIYGIMHPRKYEAVYATSPPIFGAISGLVLSRLYRVPFFFEVRDLWPDAGVETGHISKFNLLYKCSKTIERLLYRKADLVIPVTRRSEQLIKKTCPQANTFVIYNGVDTGHFKPVENAITKIDETPAPNTFRIGYVGTIGVIHDLDTVVKAAKLLEPHEDIEFVIIGDGSRSLHLQEALNHHKPRNVKWLGIKEHDKIPAYISTLDLALNPVYGTEVFESIITVKFFEYLACEVPVISMARGVLEEVGAASGAAVTIAPEEPELLAETIMVLKNSPAQRSAMKAKSRSFILQYFDREKWMTLLSENLKNRLTPSTGKSVKIPSIQDEMRISGYKW